MSLPEGYLPRAGDVLILHASVTYDVASEDQNKVFVRPVGYHSDVHLDLSKIIGIHRINWEIGDAAVVSDDIATILAIDGESAWVKFSNGEHRTVDLSALEPIQPIDPVDKPFVEPAPPPRSSGDTEEIEF